MTTLRRSPVCAGMFAALLVLACGESGSSSHGPGLASGGTSGADGGNAGGSVGSSGADSGAGGDGAVAVAKVTIAEADVAVAPGSTVTLAAQAFDANGQSLTTTITWQSSDNAVASVNAGVVTGVALGQAQITALAGGVTSAPVTVWVNPAGSTGDALDRAVAAGEITADQALVYEVWALFNDSRLPGKYRGTTHRASNAGDLLMLDAANRFDALTPTQQDAIGKYFSPPAYDPVAPATLRQFLSGRPGVCSGTLNGNWVSTATTNFRIWHNSVTMPEHASVAPLVGQYAEDTYDKLVKGRRFKAPLPDTGSCNGGDDKFDIYLMETGSISDEAAGVTEPMSSDTYKGVPTAGFLLIAAHTISAEATTPGILQSTVAHELMHAIQMAYPHLGLESYRWFREATATWAEDAVYPNNDTEHEYVAGYMDYPELPLFYPNDRHSKRMFGAYLFFQFAAKRAQGSPDDLVQKIFEFADDDPLGSIDFGLSATLQGGLKKVWPEFALALWNHEPVPDNESFRSDRVMTTASPTDVKTVSLNGAPTVQIKAPTNLTGETLVNELSVVYDHYEFAPEVSTVVFYNGYSMNMGTVPFGVQANVGPDLHSASLDAGNDFIVYSAPPEVVRGRRLWALMKIRGTWSKEDWTSKPIATFCMDKASERLEKLVLVFSNSEFTTVRESAPEANAVGAIGAQKATLVASQVPCHKYQGRFEEKLKHDDGTDKFDTSVALAATFFGQPRISNGTTASGTGSVFAGWEFNADPASIALKTTIHATLKSCGPNYTLDDNRTLGSEFYSGNRVPWFLSLVVAPGPAGAYAYTGSSLGFRYEAEQCAGSTKFLPALFTFDLNLDFAKLQTGDLANLLMTSGASGVTAPVYHTGAYPSPGEVTATWCLAAEKQDAQGNDVPRTGVCP